MAGATIAPITRKVQISKTGRYGYYSPRGKGGVGGIVWKTENEMDDLDRAWAGLPAIGSDGRYSNDIEFAQSMVEETEAQVRYATGNDRYRLMNDVIQWKMSVEHLRESESVPEGEDVTFGYAPHYRGRFDMPPNVPGYRPEPIIIPYHTYRTDDPMRIAWLRKIIRDRGNENLVEISADPELLELYGPERVHHLDAVISFETGALTGWLPREQVERMRDAKMAKP